MSLQTLMNIALAQSEEERAKAVEEHRFDNLLQPTDEEVIASFLSRCTDLEGNPLDPKDFGINVTIH